MYPTYLKILSNDGVGNLIARIDGMGNKTKYILNNLNLPTRVETPDGAFWEFRYDTSNHVKEILEPRGNYNDHVLSGSPIRHEFKYNSLGSLIEENRGTNTISPRRYKYSCNPEGNFVQRFTLLEEDW